MIGMGMIECNKRGGNKLQIITFIEYLGDETYNGFKKFPNIYINKSLTLFKKGLDIIGLRKGIKEEILSDKYERSYKLFFIMEQVIMKYSSMVGLDDHKSFICDSISKFNNAGIIANEVYLNGFINCTNCSTPVYPTVPEYFENEFDNECINTILENNKNIDLYDAIYNAIPTDVLDDCKYPYKGLCKYMILNDHEFAVIEADYVLNEIYIIQHNINGKILEV